MLKLPLHEFVNDCIARNQDADGLTLEELYGLYLSWYSLRGTPPAPARTFRAGLRAVNIQPDRAGDDGPGCLRLHRPPGTPPRIAPPEEPKEGRRRRNHPDRPETHGRKRPGSGSGRLDSRPIHRSVGERQRFRDVAKSCLLPGKIVCDDAVMSEHTEPGPAQRAAPWRRREDLTTHQMRTVGQRRAAAEEKLARHLKEAHHLAGEHLPAAEISPDV